MRISSFFVAVSVRLFRVNVAINDKKSPPAPLPSRRTHHPQSENKAGGQLHNLKTYAFDQDSRHVSVFQQFLLLYIPTPAAAPFSLFPTDPCFDLHPTGTVDGPSGHRGSTFTAENFPIFFLIRYIGCICMGFAF